MITLTRVFHFVSVFTFNFCFGVQSLEKENEELRNEIKLLKQKCDNEEELDSLTNSNKVKYLKNSVRMLKQ